MRITWIAGPPMFSRAITLAIVKVDWEIIVVRKEGVVVRFSNRLLKDSIGASVFKGRGSSRAVSTAKSTAALAAEGTLNQRNELRILGGVQVLVNSDLERKKLASL